MRGWIVGVIALIVAGLAIAALVNAPAEVSPPATPLRLEIATLDSPPDIVADEAAGLALSPDGRQLVFVGRSQGPPGLWIRDLSSGRTEPLSGTDHAVQPFWSADGSALAFFSAGQLRARDREGRITDLASATAPSGGTWLANGDIIFAPDAKSGLMRRHADGRVQTLTTPESSETGHGHPEVLADGRTVLFFVTSAVAAREGIWMTPLDTPGDRHRLVRADAHALSSAGGIVYASEGRLVAQRYDAEARRLVGRPELLGGTVGHRDGRLIVAIGGDVLVAAPPSSRLRELRWVDRRGVVDKVVGEPMEAGTTRIAPDGRRVTVTRLDPQLNTLDIAIYEGTRPVPSRISVSIDADEHAEWSPDGRQLAWTKARRTIAMKTATAAGEDVALATFATEAIVSDWPDPHTLIVTETGADNGRDIVLVSTSSKTTPRAYTAAPFNQSAGVASPDLRWMAYVSDESGQDEVYVDTYPTPGRRARLTVGGGQEPRWHRNGRQLFFRRGSEVHAVTLESRDGRLEAAASERLFDAGSDIRSFDVTVDGQRFLLNLSAPDNLRRPLTAMVNVSAAIRGLFQDSQSR